MCVFLLPWSGITMCTCVSTSHRQVFWFCDTLNLPLLHCTLYISILNSASNMTQMQTCTLYSDIEKLFIKQRPCCLIPFQAHFHAPSDTLETEMLINCVKVSPSCGYCVVFFWHYLGSVKSLPHRPKLCCTVHQVSISFSVVLLLSFNRQLLEVGLNVCHTVYKNLNTYLLWNLTVWLYSVIHLI